MKSRSLAEVAPVVAVFLFALVSVSADAAVIPLARTNYFQNFNTLVSQGQYESMPLSWYFAQSPSPSLNSQSPNQAQIPGTLSFPNNPVGDTSGAGWGVIWIDLYPPGDGLGGGLAIDNFSISPIPEPSTWTATLAATGLLGVVLWKQRGSQRKSAA